MRFPPWLPASQCESLYQLLLFRCLVFIGVCVEFVAAVAWLAELFGDPKQREKVLGFLLKPFASLGGLLVGPGQLPGRSKCQFASGDLRAA
jgi:MFS family permease